MAEAFAVDKGVDRRRCVEEMYPPREAINASGLLESFGPIQGTKGVGHIDRERDVLRVLGHVRKHNLVDELCATLLKCKLPVADGFTDGRAKMGTKGSAQYSPEYGANGDGPDTPVGLEEGNEASPQELIQCTLAGVSQSNVSNRTSKGTRGIGMIGEWSEEFVPPPEYVSSAASRGLGHASDNLIHYGFVVRAVGL